MKLIAHRGASGYAPENTLASFRKAIEMGAKAVEFDVQMSKDNELLVIHDFYLQRTTSGQGVVMFEDYKTIRSYDAGSSFDSSFSKEYVPLLEEVLDLFPEDMEIHLEIKKNFMETRNFEEDIYQLIKKRGLIETTIFSSFDHHCLQNLLKHKDVKVGVLIGASMIDTTDYLTAHGLASFSLHQEATYVTPQLVKEVHDANLKLNSFGVDDPTLAKHFMQIGVDGIFTNYLDILTRD